MKNLKTLLITLLLVSTNAISQSKKPSDFFPDPKIKIMVLGTFHFDYPNLDALKTEKKDEIDVLSPKRAKEITEIVNLIKTFKPTKIAIEASPYWKANEKLAEYNSGKHSEKRDERYQLGIRIASELNLKEIYSIDATSILNEIGEKFGMKDSLYFKNKSLDYDFRSDDEISKRYLDFYKNSVYKETSLLKQLKYMNSPEYHQYEYGAYLTGDFKLREFDGADMLATYWYSRNLRILRNIQRITQNPNDRILVIIGNGHASVLRQLLKSSPEYDFIEVSKYLK